MRNLIEELFSDEPHADLDVLEELGRLAEAAAKVEKMTAKKTPLAKVLKDLGLDAGDLQTTPDGMVLNLADEESYRLIVRTLGTLDKINQLAENGWVPLFGGESTLNSSPANFQVKFIELDDHTTVPEKSDKPVNMDKVLKDAAYWVPDVDSNGYPKKS